MGSIDSKPIERVDTRPAQFFFSTNTDNKVHEIFMSVLDGLLMSDTYITVANRLQHVGDTIFRDRCDLFDLPNDLTFVVRIDCYTQVNVYIGEMNGKKCYIVIE